ncbi:MAG: cobalamin-binding protein [Bacillota bacterium]|nr:cobalamin-binding protein [Bacillota bacterium]HHU30670.1 cobalamin-binding protein [Bacillota bacterium]
MQKKWLAALLVLAMIIMAFAGCSRQNESLENNKNNESGENIENVPEETTGSFPLTVTDELGREVTIERKPERIISLLPSLTETLFALGVGEAVVGVTTDCSFPEEAKEVEKVADWTTIDMEKILALEPDLVLADDSSALLDQLYFLDDAGIPYVLIDPDSMEEVTGCIMEVARVVGALEEGEKITEEIRKGIEEIQEKAAAVPEDEKPQVIILIDTETFFTVGIGEYLSDLVTAAGGINAAAELGSSYFELSEENILDIDPDVIICTWYRRDELLARDSWQNMKAVKNGRIYDVTPDLVSRPGPRIVQGLEEIYKAIAGQP